ncbi:MAG: TIGR02996 domain-containing protein [Fimbriiglobus sp.]|jgi:uncharacterized protein (TIGR02996 family)|nr:TIGR02996 domain-containing protein [Fimbriiglobus sp.]
MRLHPDAKAFVTRILADPTDIVIRTVFADWLDDQGGTANENWARYIRLRADAAVSHGTDRDLFREEADQLAPHLKARLTVPATRLAPHFHHYLDLLPADRYIVTLDGFDLPPEPNARLSDVNARAARSLVLAEVGGVFAVATDLPLPGLARVLGQRLNGRAILFPAFSVEMDAALARTFPPPPLPAPTSLPLDVLNRKLASAAAARLVGEARHDHATQIEVVAQPSGYEVRFVVGGRTLRKETLPPEIGELLVKEFFSADAYNRLHARARPRNTSFGAGVQVDL